MDFYQSKIMKKTITYIAFFLYLSLPVGMFVFRLGGNISINPIIDSIIVLALIPVSTIIVSCAFFGGRMGAIIGTIITIALAILIIEWIFKKPTSA